MRAVILTGHFPQQKRQGSIHWISRHLQDSGWHVTHITVGYSWISKLRGDNRLRALEYTPRPGLEHPTETLSTLFRYSPIHPVRSKSALINMALKTIMRVFPLYWARHLPPHLARADLVICESGAPVLLAPLIAKHAPDVPRIYRVNDDIRLLNAPDTLIAAEMAFSDCFTRISSASPHLLARFKHPNKTLDPMGIPKSAMQGSFENPYKVKATHVVCAGTTQLDFMAVERIARSRSAWQIHVFGRLKAEPPDLPNVTWHSEQPYETVLPYIAHADIGLAPYIDAPGVEYQTTNSNRILLYRHFGLPVLGPDRLCHPSAPSIIGYGIPDAFDRCASYGRQPEDIPDWSELAQALVQNEIMEPPTDVSSVPAIAT